MDSSLAAYLPQDRRLALVRDEPLPEYAYGAALFADIAGFTALTEALDRALGHRRGAEELTRHLNRVCAALIAEVDRYGGSVIDFAGDSITCWFSDEKVKGKRQKATADDQDPPFIFDLLPSAQRAVACALALQQAMHTFATIALPDGTTTTLALKVAVASGPARRFAVGDPNVRLFDVLVGAPLSRVAAGEHLARPGEVLIDEATVAALGDVIAITEWRADAESGERFAVATTTDDRRPTTNEAGITPSPRHPVTPSPAQLRPWLLPAVYERHQAGLGEFLTELRPAIALFLRFTGIDFADDSAAGAKLDGLIRLVQQIVARYDGALLQLTIGDKGSYLYVVFGAPTAHEDDPRRAVVAALELHLALAARNDLDTIQVGISRGVMRVGAYGGPTRQTYGVLGDDVNLAARLMALAAPGELLISGRVQAGIGTGFALEPRAPIRLKGKAEPLPVFAVVGHSQRRAIRLEEPTYTLPMVGRAAELAMIATTLNLALSGQGQVIGIVAEAGMGKSRLVAEAIRLARRNGMQGYGGACQSSGMNTSYLVWGPIWRAFFDLDPAAPIRRQIRALEGLVGDWAPERIEALPLLGPLLGLPLAENDFTRTLEAQFRKSVLELLLLDCLRAAGREAQAEGSGLLLILEDLHWIDALSHDLLERVAQTIVDLPVLILLAYRPPELLRLQAPRVEALAHFTRVALADLAVAEAEQLIRAKLAQLFPERGGAVPDALIARITTKAQGNPFYVEELLNYLHDRGLDPQDTAALAALDLPSSLHTLILSRIDQLSARQQATLKVASVIGRRFLHAWLHGAFPILGAPEPLKADLDELAKLELTPLDTPEPELAYLFKHVVTQEVAYESLTTQARAGLHEQLAAFLEQLASDNAERFLDRLAFHYERSDNLPKKRHYLRRAGEAAAARFANDAAVDYLSRALDLAPEDDLAERWALLWERVRVFHLMGTRTAEVDDLNVLGELAEAFDDDVRRAEVGIQRARFAEAIAAYADGVAAAERALRLAQAAGEIGTAAAAGLALGMALTRQGDFAHADESLAHAFFLAEQAGLAHVAADCLVFRSIVAWGEGDYQRLHNLELQAYKRFRSLGLLRGQGETLTGMGETARGYGDYSAARTYYEQSLDIFLGIGDRRYASIVYADLGVIANAEGLYALARTSFEQGLHLAREVGDRWIEGSLMGHLGNALAGLGKPVEAAAAFRSAVDRLSEVGLTRAATEPLAGLVRVALASGDTAQALSYTEQILMHLADNGSMNGTHEPLRVALTCYQALQAANDPRAGVVLERTHDRLQERAAKITDDTMRRSFLEHVAYHSKIVAAWAAHCEERSNES